MSVVTVDGSTHGCWSGDAGPPGSTALLVAWSLLVAVPWCPRATAQALSSLCWGGRTPLLLGWAEGLLRAPQCP